MAKRIAKWAELISRPKMWKHKHPQPNVLQNQIPASEHRCILWSTTFPGLLRGYSYLHFGSGSGIL